MDCRSARLHSASRFQRARWKSTWPTVCVCAPSECSRSAAPAQGRRERKLRPRGKDNRMNSNDAEIAAGQWLARLDRDDPGPRDLAAFEQWKSEDPRHAAAYARLAATWQALDRVQAIRPGSDEPIDEDYLNIAMQNPYFRRPPEPHAVPLSVPFVPSVPSSSIAPRHPGLWHRPRILFPAAASVLVALAALWISHGIGGSHTFSTGIGG